MSEVRNSHGGLTKYEVGSLGELWKLAFPLMLMSLSTFGMIFADRMIVSMYNVDAMNAVGMVMMVFEAFHFGILMVALIAEVFVGQYNGAGEERRIGKPVWAMVWFSVMSAVMFWPCGVYLGEVVLQEMFWEHGVVYYKVLMLFGPLPPLMGALGAFFIGRGKTFVVTAVVALGNVVNLGLDIVFVFGVDGWLAPMGTMGAALATGLGLSAQVLILGYIFLKRENRERFGTGDWGFDLGEFKKCLSVGWPNAVSMSVSILAWVVFFRWVGECGFVYLTTLIICQNYFYFFLIITDGIGKGLCAICANLMGGGRHDEVKKVLWSGVKLIGIFGVILLVPLVLWQGPFIEMFLQGEIEAGVMREIIEMSKGALVWQWALFLFFGGYWILSSQLMAAGDTRFLMYANMFSAWFFLVVPAYLALEVFGLDPSISWKLMVFDIAMCMLLFLWRYRSGKWREKVLV